MLFLCFRYFQGISTYQVPSCIFTQNSHFLISCTSQIFHFVALVIVAVVARAGVFSVLFIYLRCSFFGNSSIVTAHKNCRKCANYNKSYLGNTNRTVIKRRNETFQITKKIRKHMSNSPRQCQIKFIS